MAQGSDLKAKPTSLFRRLSRWSDSGIRLAAASVAFALALAPFAHASSCRREIVVRIKTRAGQSCWTYRGAATAFVGNFLRGQRRTAHMMGQSSEFDPRSGRVRNLWRARDPNVEGPGGFFFGDAEAPGSLTFVAPANGTYRISFSPCAMWGAPGTVEICAH